MKRSPSEKARRSTRPGPEWRLSFSEVRFFLHSFCLCGLQSPKSTNVVGKVRAIGVSNFSIKNLDLLLKTAKIVPAVNQVQGHPYHPNSSLHTYSKAKGIHLTAYSPLGQYDSPILRDPKIVAIANEHKKTPGQVVLSWGVQRGWSVVPKSANSERMAQNLEVSGFW